MTRLRIIQVIVLVYLTISLGCGLLKFQNEPRLVNFDIDQIKERGSIIALVDQSSYSFFLHKGQPVGYEFDLLKDFAEEQNLELEIKVVKDFVTMAKMLRNGEGDIAACNLKYDQEQSKLIQLTQPYVFTKHVLVKLKNKSKFDLCDLESDEIVVRKGSFSAIASEEFARDNKLELNLQFTHNDIENSELIKMVEKKKIKYAIVDINSAYLNAIYNPKLDLSTIVADSVPVSFGVRTNAKGLKTLIDQWITDNASDRLAIYDKYFKTDKERSKVVHNAKLGISEYDAIIKREAKKLGWDWRLLSSIVCQESHFDPYAKSGKGAAGLMQIIPSTAKMLGLDSISVHDPEQSLIAGVKYLKQLDKIWIKHIEDKDERVKFVLASYNAGIGHVIDARNLALKYDFNPNIWDGNVADFILKKSEKAYYSDEVVKSGYCRGKETFSYVSNIIDRYHLYASIAPVAKPSETNL